MTCVALNNNASRAITGSSDCTVRIWQSDVGALMHVLRGHAHIVSCVAINSTGSHAVSGSHDCSLIVWDVEQGTQLYGLQVYFS